MPKSKKGIAIKKIDRNTIIEGNTIQNLST